jgi:hypothetical protein
MWLCRKCKAKNNSAKVGLADYIQARKQSIYVLCTKLSNLTHVTPSRLLHTEFPANHRTGFQRKMRENISYKWQWDFRQHFLAAGAPWIWISYIFWLKGIIQRILTWVKTRLKQPILINWRLASFLHLVLKGHRYVRSIKPFSAA